MTRSGALFLLLATLALSACASPDSVPEHSSGMSPADEFISHVTPGSENESKFNRGIGATPTY